MAGPGGPEVGRASVRVAPDTEGFASELRKKLNAIEKSEKLEIPVKFNADREQLQRELESLRVKAIGVPLEFDRGEAKRDLDAALAGLKGGPVSIDTKFEIDREKLRAQLARMRNSIKVQVGWEIDREKLRAALARMRNTTTVQVKFNLDRAGLRAAIATATAAQKPKVSVSLTPDLTDFRAKMAALPNGRASVTLNPDTATFRARLANLTGRVNVELNPNITALRARLREIGNLSIKVELNVPQSSITALEAKLSRLDGRNVNIKIDIDGIALALAELAALEVALNRIDGQNIRVTIDVDGLAAALAQLAAFSAALAALNGVNAGSSSFGRGISHGLAQIVFYLAAAVVLAPLLAIAGAAITAAWGLVSAAIAAVPAALALLAGPIAAVMIGMEGIKRAAKTLEPEFKKLQKAVEDSLQHGFTKAFNIIRPIMPAIQSGMVAIANAMDPIVNDLALMAVHAVQVGTIPKIFDNIQAALRNVSPGLSTFVNSLLQLASQKSAFQVLEVAINTFTAAWSDMVQEVISNGVFDKAMSGLGSVLGSLEKGFVSLVKNGLTLFAAAAPGITSFFDDLTNFFNRFNWTKLGGAVGNVFKGLGDALKDVPQQTITDIEDAFVHIGDVFTSPQFKQGIQDFLGLTAGIVHTIADLSEAFGIASTAISDFFGFLGEGEDVYGDMAKATEDFLKWFHDQWWNADLGDLFGKNAAFGEGKNPFDFLTKLKKPELPSWLDDLFGGKDLPTADDFDFSDAVKEAFDRAAEAAKNGAEAVIAALKPGNGGDNPWEALVAALGASLERGLEQVQVKATIASHFIEEALKPLGGDVVTPWATLTTKISTAVTTGLTNAAAVVKAQVKAITDALAPPVGTAALWAATMAAIAGSITIGFAGAAAAATISAAAVGEALQPPVGLDLAWTTAITAITNAIATGMATAVTTATTQSQAVMTALAPIGDPAAPWTAALAGLAGAVTTQLAAAEAAARGGSAAIAAALKPPGDLSGAWVTGLGAIVNVISGSFALMQAAVDGGMASIRQGFATGFDGLGDIATTGLDAVEQAVTDKLNAIIEKVKTLGQQLADALAAIKPTSSIGDAVRDMFNDFQAIIVETIKGVFNIIKETIKAQIEGVTTLFTTISESFANGFKAISDSLTASSQIVSTAFDQLRTTFADKIKAIKEAITTAFSGDLGAGIAAAFAGIGIAIGNALTDIGNTITLGVAGWRTAIDGALDLITASFTTKPTTWAAPVIAAMAAIGLAITTGTAGWQLAIDTALLAISTSFATQTLAWSLPVTAAMMAITNAFTLGTAGWLLSVNAALLAITTAFQTGTLSWSLSVQAALTAITNLFALAGAAWPLSITTAMNTITTVIQTAMDAVVQWVTAALTTMNELFTAFGETITQVITSAMEAVTSAVQTGMDAAKSALESAVQSMISTLQGAVESFRAAGSNMGAALAEGLRSQLGAVQDAAAALANAASSAVAAAARIASPSKVFLSLGSYMGQGLEQGIRDSVPDVIREAKRLSDAVADAVNMPTLETSTWAAELQTNLRNGAAELNAQLTRGGVNGRQVSITNQFYTDASARDSDVVARVQRRQAALGLFA